MLDTIAKSAPVVSPRVYALILSSPRLRQILLPGGVPVSPYEILDYRGALFLHDARGARATFYRKERVRFLQDGVSGILDHFWGDGVGLTFYQNEAGTVEDSFNDEGRRHLVVGLKRPMGRGEEMTFEVIRTAMVAFTREEEWMETTIDHPIEHLNRSVVFPRERPCRRARLYYGSRDLPLPITSLADGRTAVGFGALKPSIATPYTLRWSW